MVKIIEPQKSRMHSVTSPWVSRPFIVGRQKDLRSSGWEIGRHLEEKVWAWVRWTLGLKPSLSRVWFFCNPPGSSVHGNLQARIREWVAISFSRGYSWPRDQICISCLTGGFFTAEPWGKPLHCLAWLQSLIGELRSHKATWYSRKRSPDTLSIPFLLWNVDSLAVCIETGFGHFNSIKILLPEFTVRDLLDS